MIAFVSSLLYFAILEQLIVIATNLKTLKNEK